MTAADTIYEDLFNRIMRGAIRRGTLMTEELWAKHFNVSRTPVREAFRRLIQDGLIARDTRSLQIAQPSPAKIDEVYRIMGVLEGLGCAEATERCSKALLRSLNRLNAEMRRAVQEPDADEAVRLNAQFHDAIIRGAHNSSLLDSINRYNALMLHYRNIAMRIPNRLRASVIEHDTILHAIESGDAPAAERAMRDHLEQGRLTLSAVFDAASVVQGVDPPGPTIDPRRRRRLADTSKYCSEEC